MKKYFYSTLLQNNLLCIDFLLSKCIVMELLCWLSSEKNIFVIDWLNIFVNIVRASFGVWMPLWLWNHMFFDFHIHIKIVSHDQADHPKELTGKPIANV